MMILANPVRKRHVTEAICALADDGMVFGCHFTPHGGQAWRVK